MSHAASPADPDVLADFLARLGQAYLACGEQTPRVEAILRRVAAAHGRDRSQVVAFPTALFLGLEDGKGQLVTVAEGPVRALRLDQLADVYALGEEAERAAVTPAEGLDRLDAILRQSPRFGPLGSLAGHVVLTMGLALVLAPSLTNLAAAAVLGAAVGLLKLSRRGQPGFAVPLPVVAAGLVSALVFLALQRGLPVDPGQSLIPPLVTFLPGALLTLGMVELAYGDMVSGSARLATGFVQLVLLAFGLAAGAALVGYAPEHLVETAPAPPGPAWAAWVGVLVFGLGVFLHFSAPRRSLGWIFLVLLAAFAAQRLAAPVGPAGSSFFGMLVTTLLAYLLQRTPGGPPAMVTFLPAFWLLVPGALGLVSVKHLLSDRAAGLDGLVTTVFGFASIAVGTLLGASLYRSLTDRRS